MDWASIADKGAVLALLVLILATGQRGLWVFRRELDRRDADLAYARKERDEWKELALRGSSITGRAVDLAERRSGPREETLP